MGIRSSLVFALVTCGAVLGAAAGEDPPTRDPIQTSLESIARGTVEEQVAAIEVLGAAWPSGARGVPLLVAAIGDDDPRVAAAASTALERLGDRGAQRLAAFLADPEDRDRGRLLKVLKVVRSVGAQFTVKDVAFAFPTDHNRACGPTSAVAPCVCVAILPAWDGHPNHGLYSVYLLLCDRVAGRGGGAIEAPTPRTIELASAALAVRAQAALAPQPERALPEAIGELWSSSDAHVRDAASLLVWRLRGGAPPEPPSQERTDLQPADVPAPRRTGGSAPIAPEEGEKSVEALLAALAASPQGSREASEAVWKLSLLVGGADPETRARVLGALSAAKRSADRPFLDWRAIEALSRWAPNAREAVPGLVQALDGTLRVWDGLALRQEAGQPVDLVADYLRLGNDVHEAFVQRFPLVEILGRIGPSATAALPTITSLLTSSDLLLAYLARTSLTRIRPSSAGDR